MLDSVNGRVGPSQASDGDSNTHYLLPSCEDRSKAASSEEITELWICKPTARIWICDEKNMHRAHMVIQMTYLLAHDHVPCEQVTSEAMQGQFKRSKWPSLDSSIPKGAYSSADAVRASQRLQPSHQLASNAK